jgi:hypothetical protein
MTEVNREASPSSTILLECMSAPAALPGPADGR